MTEIYICFILYIFCFVCWVMQKVLDIHPVWENYFYLTLIGIIASVLVEGVIRNIIFN